MTQILSWFKEAGIAAPKPAECQKMATKNKDSVPQLIQLAVNNEDLVEIDKDYYLHADVEAVIREKLTNSDELKRGATMSELKEILETTRKYSISLFEYYDRIGFTLRDGDIRTLNEQIEQLK